MRSEITEQPLSLVKNKTRLMGISIILIVLCHAGTTGISVLKIFAPALIGCDFFMILSGYSLGYSYQNHAIGHFFKRRVVRIYPMYLILSLSQCLVYQVTGNSLTIIDWAASACFMPFYGLWGGVIVDWYLSISFLLYFLYPLLFKISPTKMITFIILFVFVVQFFYSMDVLALNTPFACGLARVPMFCWGIYLFKTKLRRTYPMSLLFVLVLILALYLMLSEDVRFHFFYIISLIAPFMLFLMNYLTYKLHWNFIGIIVDILGKYTIEIYVANLTMVTLCNLISVENKIKLYIYLLGTLLLSIIWISVNKRIRYILK